MTTSHDGIEGFVHDLKCTVRECIDCGCLTPGGVTRCKRCVRDLAARDARPTDEELRLGRELACTTDMSARAAALEADLEQIRDLMPADWSNHTPEGGQAMAEVVRMLDVLRDENESLCCQLYDANKLVSGLMISGLAECERLRAELAETERGSSITPTEMPADIVTEGETCEGNAEVYVAGVYLGVWPVRRIDQLRNALAKRWPRAEATESRPIPKPAVTVAESEDESGDWDVKLGPHLVAWAGVQRHAETMALRLREAVEEIWADDDPAPQRAANLLVQLHALPASACPCQSAVENPGPHHVPACPWSDPEYDPDADDAYREAPAPQQTSEASSEAAPSFGDALTSRPAEAPESRASLAPLDDVARAAWASATALLGREGANVRVLLSEAASKVDAWRAHLERMRAIESEMADALPAPLTREEAERMAKEWIGLYVGGGFHDEEAPLTDLLLSVAGRGVEAPATAPCGVVYGASAPCTKSAGHEGSHYAETSGETFTANFPLCLSRARTVDVEARVREARRAALEAEREAIASALESVTDDALSSTYAHIAESIRARAILDGVRARREGGGE